ncbi:MAG: L,D-transpeptidase family protein [Pseudomonadota bacterium]
MKRRHLLLSAPALVVSRPAFANGKRLLTYDGPQITQVTIDKTVRRMYLSSNGKVIKKYRIALGFAPYGHKEFLGDGKTPEGLYRIDRKNENSRYHLSLGISYPNRVDWENARAQGKHPGGDIFIHGGPVTSREKAGGRDWTAGCIAVSNRQMEEVYAMVELETLVYIRV